MGHGTSTLGAGSSTYQTGGSYAQSSSILSQSLKNKGKHQYNYTLNQLTLFSSQTGSQHGSGLPLAPSSSMQKTGGSSYGAYGIAKNNKMSDVSALLLWPWFCNGLLFILSSIL